ncbi:uncharacterized protein [Aegilops tauschii subsp. strangulata]
MHLGRRYDSGASKRRKKQKVKEDTRKQKGALDKFVVKEPQPNSENQTVDANIDDAPSGDPEEAEAHIGETNEGDDINNVDEGDDSNHVDEGANIVAEGDDSNHVDEGANIAAEGDDAKVADNTNNSVQPNIFDPRTWDALDPTMIDILVQKGPKRDLSIEHGPTDKFGRRFSILAYTRVLSNGEKCDREWLVYSKVLDKVFYFCCKLLRKGHVRGQLANDGFSDWHHLISRLKEHENGREHVTNMSSWYDLRLRLEKNQTIDKVAQQELEKEREHWRKVLLRILLIVKFLAEHNIAFRGSNSKVYQDSNGNFLGLVQMLAEFDPVIKEHVDRITSDKIRDHYLGPSIQNELINLLAAAIRWESRVDSVKAIRIQLPEIREALLQVAEIDKDPSTSSEAQSLAENNLCDFEFLVSIIIWYEILSAVNLISKELQSKDMLIDFSIESVKGLISFFTKYRESGFPKALEAAKEIAKEMDINPEFRTKRKIKRKRQFGEGADDSSIVSQSAEESFRVNYFLHIVDQAIVSLNTRFEQYEGYEKIFGFLFTSDRLRSLDDKSLLVACVNLEDALKSGEHKDIDGLELCCELLFLQGSLQKSMGPLDILNFLKKRSLIYPNAVIAYRILLTIPVTVASAERSFSKLKLLKSYLRSTMTQERLNGLATIALENDVLEKINYEDLIEDFISRNTRRMLLFGRK